MSHPPAIRPGDTIFLRGGTYNLRGQLATYFSYLTGSAAAPITVRNYPGERAIIDWDYLIIVDGSHVNYVGLEWMSSARLKVLSHAWADGRPSALRFRGARNKLINCVLHDLGETDISYEAVGTEYYGNIMYYFGFITPLRGVGTTAYTQSENVRIEDNLMFQQFGHSLQLYGSDTVSLRNITVEGNAIFKPGALGPTRGFNMVVWPGLTAENIAVRNNFAYSPLTDGTSVDLRGATPSEGGGPNPNTNLDVTDNWFLGGAPALRMGTWNPTDFTGNRIYSRYGLVWAFKNGSYTYNWNSNQYYYEGSRTDVMFSMNNPFITSFAAWQAQTGFDSVSTFATGFPTGVNVFVRANAYEQGRAHIVVINGNAATTATVSLANTGLQNGQTYEIRDAQNFFGPAIATGVYTAASPNVTLPLELTAVAPLIGAGEPGNEAVQLPVHTTKEFNAFVVLPAP